MAVGKDQVVPFLDVIGIVMLVSLALTMLAAAAMMIAMAVDVWRDRW